jgi:outer membrane murein-binding lipoprotein Lpp
MAKAPPPPPQGGGSNFNLSKGDLAKIEQLTREVQALENDRAAVNADINEKRASIKALGIDMSAWAAAKRRKEMDPDDRDNFDRSAAMCNAALGITIQGDLFEPAGDGGTLPNSLN